MRLVHLTKSIWPKLGLENDQKNFRMMNLNHWTWQKFMTPTNINFTPQKYAGAIGLNRSPSTGSQARTGWDTFLASLCSSSRKNIRHRDPGHKIKVCWFQFWSCSIVKVCHCHDSVIFIRSSWFGHVSIPHLNLSPQYIKKYSTYSLHLCDFEVYIYRRLSFRWPL